MKLRHKEKGYLAFSSWFNIHSMGELIVDFEGSGCSSDFISEYEVFLEARQEWKDMSQAFEDRDIIVDNYNTYFFEPKSEEDKIRGYTL
jgi:hypothetical protein